MRCAMDGTGTPDRVDLVVLGEMLAAFVATSEDDMLRRLRESLAKIGGGGGGGRPGQLDDGMIKKAFERFDVNGDGRISGESPPLGLGMKGTVLDQESLPLLEMLLSLLAGGCSAAVHRVHGLPMQRNADGPVWRRSVEEFRTGLQTMATGLGVEEIDRLLDLADENGETLSPTHTHTLPLKALWWGRLVRSHVQLAARVKAFWWGRCR